MISCVPCRYGRHMVDVLVKSCIENVKLLNQMGLKAGRDFTSEKGAVAKGRPSALLLRFKDKDKALIFKLRAISG